jgi:hypothetical protein
MVIHTVIRRKPEYMSAILLAGRNAMALARASRAIWNATVICSSEWLRATTTSCRWDQAFSADGGSAWETNWI